MPRRGRPCKPVVDPATLETMTVPEVLAYLRQLGRGMGRKTLYAAILRKDLPAYEDDLRHDRDGRPLLVFRRVDIDKWLVSSLRPHQPIRLSALRAV